MRLSYLYQIRNLVNGKLYIGSSNRPTKRFYEHRCELKRGTHYNGYLQKAWQKYGEEMFVFEILGEVPLNERYSREADLIIKENTMDQDYGYNLVLPDDTGAYVHTTTSNEKIRQAIIQQNLEKLGRVVFINLATMERTFYDYKAPLKAIGINTNKKLNRLSKTYWNYESALKDVPVDFYTKLLEKCEEAQPVSIPVYCFNIRTKELVQNFKSIGEASKALNLKFSYISKALNPKYSKYKVREYTFSKTNIFPEKSIAPRKRTRKTPVVRYEISNGIENFYGKFIKDFSAIVEGTSTCGWKKLLNGTKKIYKGFTLTRL